ncbi:hypothetical protein F442_11652 [Phytophthora nicotianae P10297]|uniref:Uncharacterized protein n=5 Tax=Phytophthora nicotianae TaxID=4792 RepID=W2Q1H9_PHYN3|nr:hypothetical protein PPTG_23294 [Phytophthora nicotianae INRA-310]ETI43321.1 hypothetical protein F443_11749 [Phytophthora nicotianae P1569]ETM43191.1 hypothetical protein L914_11283 [Phytophthora nicotianae]ETO71972.1 hypothetical protein F444_11833 [Phytophthora nicotianae P1976]ETP41123.1 hypothetical protein F442_11652 [Phytophthora nicotianae P10297]ETN06972.1 hypothetical protein PPTG_23294 [Phytophthora nicotianae INRA-310]
MPRGPEKKVAAKKKSVDKRCPKCKKVFAICYSVKRT